MKYIIAIDHKASSDKTWSYFELTNSKRDLAIAEGIFKGFQQSEVHCVLVLKQVSKHQYKLMLRVFGNGFVEVPEQHELDCLWDVYRFN